MTVALVTTTPDDIGTPDLDMADLLTSLAALGIDAEAPVWHDSSVLWDRYELVVIRSPWDYSQRWVQFVEWLDRISDLNVVQNCSHTIRWNLDKRYLEELSELGVPAVPSHFATTPAQARHAIGDIVGNVVVKPTVSAGAKNTGLFGAGDPAALTLADAIISSGKEVIIQPAIPSVATEGETALVFFDGVFSHALTKGPILALGGELLGGEYCEHITATTPTLAQVEVAQHTLTAAESLIRSNAGCDCSWETPLYARLDLVDSQDGPLLLEAELFEPSFFVHTSADSSDRFARAVRSRL